jgi:ATP-dependent DNA ligase
MEWELKNGVIEFNTIYSGNRFWSIYVKSNVVLRNKNQLEDKNLLAFYYANYGVNNGKLTISSDTSVNGKNIGRSNETTNLQQAIKESISIINKKIKAGYKFEENNTDIVTEEKDKKYYPMALNIYGNHKNKIIYPVAIQPKLDGIRMTATINSEGDVEIISRRLHEIYGFESIKNDLKDIIFKLKEKYGSKFKFIDGELYKHGLHLQDISGVVRREDTGGKEVMEYHIFDACVEDIGFIDRYKAIEEVMSCYNGIKLILTKTIICNSEKEGDELFNKFLKDNYEGTVYKTIDFKYEFSEEREKRSLRYLKRKKQMDAEYEITNYSEGKGKFKGLVIFTLKTKDGLEFQSVPTGNAEYRKNIYCECVKDFSKYKGMLAKLKFDDLSKSGIPVRAVIVQVIRDIAFD